MNSKMEVDEPKKRFQVKKWNSVSLWAWDINEQDCAICRNHIMEYCIDCQANQSNNNTDNCNAAWGQCSHVFHFHCIDKWLKNRHVCPLDNVDWEFQRIGK